MSEPKKKTKKKVGRPDKYDPKYCEYILKWSKDGETVVYWAAKLGVSKSTVHRWREIYPEFSDAFSQAMTNAEVWWLQQAKENLTGKTFQSSTHKFMMASMFKGDYVEKKEVNAEVTTKEFKLSYKDEDES